jgi:hypothetical protein
MKHRGKFEPSDITKEQVAQFKRELIVLKAINEDRLPKAFSEENLNGMDNDEVVRVLKQLLRIKQITSTNHTIEPLDVISRRTIIGLTEFGYGEAMGINENDAQGMREYLSLAFTIGKEVTDHLFRMKNR